MKLIAAAEDYGHDVRNGSIDFSDERLLSGIGI